MAHRPDGFVSLKSLKQGSASPRDTLELIRRIYFTTTRQTIEHDFMHAIELLKNLETEEEREKATAYMHGISELRKEWTTKRVKATGRGKAKGKGQRVKGKS